MALVDADYLLESPTASTIYEHVADLPIVDVHTHVDPDAVLANDGWADPWELIGATDHYVWTLMRNRGVDEDRITGDASPREKWTALANVLPRCIGSPTYEWIHLDLARRFGIETPLRPETADEIWEDVAAALEGDAITQQALLAEMDVEVLCTTDSPTASLDAHAALADEVETDVRPTWRADPAVAIRSSGFNRFADQLGAATDVDTGTFEGFLDALAVSREHFAERGCVATDIGIEVPVSRPVATARAARIFAERRDGGVPDEEACADFVAFMLEHIATADGMDDWVTQLHVGPVRNYRGWLDEEVSGGAGNAVAASRVDIVGGLRDLLDATDRSAEYVLYCVDPSHYAELGTIARAYDTVSVGPPWWWNDSPYGMAEQLAYVGTVDSLANHAGMVSDSRKLPSLDSRFEMFRRVLANLLGRGVERGQYPQTEAMDVAAYLSYDRPKEIFGV